MPQAIEPSPGMLKQMIVQNDEKHDDQHRRLRTDLVEGLDDVRDEIGNLRTAQSQDHDKVTLLIANRERRLDSKHELTAFKAVLIGAVISGGFHLVEAIVTQFIAMAKGGP